MPDAVIDACCLIDLLASGHAEGVLRASGHTWHLPSSVQAEVKYCRQHDTTEPGSFLLIPADLSGLISLDVLTVCAPENQSELDLFTHYATIFRSDGESMTLAIAKQRDWIVATDDRKAIRVARQEGLTVMSCPEMVKAWANATVPGQALLNRVLLDIQVLAQFRPNSTMSGYQWWVDELAKTSP
ncbi:MAG: hypothetical protein L0Y72_06895 [Gemmataceae bacterium]|nr:hypothetical protein [Gemmataceae bacterium]